MIETIRVKQFWQSLWRVNPLSELPSKPSRKIESNAMAKAKMNIAKEFEITPM